MHTTSIEDQPALDKRCREAHPIHITVGDETFERNDVSAKRFGESERSHNRRDRKGAPYVFIGNVKYRPMERMNAFILASIKQGKPESPKRRKPSRSRQPEREAVR
jgi:hypothetical protein